jgi:xylan 1,4-beta-xylosidase
MNTMFRCDMSATPTPLVHFWEHTVGSCHAPLALRADWQAQMCRAHRELGFRHVRFHGLLCDDVGTLICQSDKLVYSFFNADSIFDFLLSIGMKPFVELSFMPATLASGDKVVFHYRANVTPPKDYAQWATLIRKLTAHWVQRYGLDEVRQWFFEVWNEPNLDAFGTGQQSDYFTLYRYTVEAIKSVDPALRVGGPATAANAWVEDFLKFCADENIPRDFITTHHYPTDAFGQPGDDTETQLAKSERSVLRRQTAGVRRQAGDLPIYYTEWCTSSNPRDPMHDEIYASAFIVKTVMEANGLVQGYSYWTFADIFEENYFPSVPFHGGFGLLNIHGIAKPAYRAFELLHTLGTAMLPVDGEHPTVDVWAIGDARTVTILISNFALPRHQIASETIQVRIANSPALRKATVRRIDADHANAKRRWQEMGSPEYLSARLVAELDKISQCESESFVVTDSGGASEFDLEIPPLGVAAVTLEFEETSRAARA